MTYSYPSQPSGSMAAIHRLPDTGKTLGLGLGYLSMMLLARRFKSLPLVCSHFGADRRIVAFITEAPTVRAILTHLGESCEAPPISPFRGPPEWEMLDETVEIDPIHPELEYEFDQSVSWQTTPRLIPGPSSRWSEIPLPLLAPIAAQIAASSLLASPSLSSNRFADSVPPGFDPIETLSSPL